MTSSRCPAVGLSVGSTTLAAVTADRAITGRPVVLRGGALIDAFVERVGDPIGIVASDGSVHDAAGLLAEALGDLALGVVAGAGVPAAVGVAYPAHWQRPAVESLRRALRGLPGWFSVRLDLVPDHLAALATLRAELPAQGVVAVCDFGGSATTITLVDLAGSRATGAPLRHQEFCGDAVDRALLGYVLDVAGMTPGAAETSAIRPLTRLRAQCRAAKERLSSHTVAVIPGRPAGLRRDIRLTRSELEELITEPLSDVAQMVRDMLQRNGFVPSDLVAVVSVGGGAAIPSVTTTLSHQLRVPVLTRREPGLVAAVGAVPSAAGSGNPEPAPVAWSAAADVPHLVASPRPRKPVPRVPAPAVPAPIPWHRRPLMVAAATLTVIAGAGGGAALTLAIDHRGAPAEAPRSVVAVAPEAAVSLPPPG